MKRHMYMSYITKRRLVRERYYVVQMEVAYEKNMGIAKFQKSDDRTVYCRYLKCDPGFLSGNYFAF